MSVLGPDRVWDSSSPLDAYNLHVVWWIAVRVTLAGIGVQDAFDVERDRINLSTSTKSRIT
jgi:4-hydroxybenzoate polyprenyltransferase